MGLQAAYFEGRLAVQRKLQQHGANERTSIKVSGDLDELLGMDTVGIHDKDDFPFIGEQQHCFIGQSQLLGVLPESPKI